jgi:hypothetical protein
MHICCRDLHGSLCLWLQPLRLLHLPSLFTLITLLVHLHKAMKQLFSQSWGIGYLPSHSLFLGTCKIQNFQTLPVPYMIPSHWGCMISWPVDGNNILNTCYRNMRHKATTDSMVVQTTFWAWPILKTTTGRSPEPILFTLCPRNLFL